MTNTVHFKTVYKSYVSATTFTVVGGVSGATKGKNFPENLRLYLGSAGGEKI